MFDGTLYGRCGRNASRCGSRSTPERGVFSSEYIPFVKRGVRFTFTQAFCETRSALSLQVLNYAVKLALRQPNDTRVQSLASFVLEMARFDLSHDLRDRARFMTAMLGLATADEGVDEAALLALNAKADQVRACIKVRTNILPKERCSPRHARMAIK